jgi:hypothetical protein
VPAVHAPAHGQMNGQAILKAIRLDLEACSELGKRVELRRLELRTSCMPYLVRLPVTAADLATFNM